jgi:VanZ family protein
VLNKKSYFFIAISWTCFVSILSLITISSEIGESINVDFKDKYVHFLFYFVFVIVWFLFLDRTKYAKSVKLLALILAITFGVLMEICQGLFTTTRTPDVYDVLANSIGAFTGIIILNLFYKNTKTTP